MTEGRTRGPWNRVSWSPRARTLALLVSGAIVAGAGIAFLRRRHLKNQSKLLGERGTTGSREKGEVEPGEKNGQNDVEAGLSEAAVREEDQDSSALEASKENSATLARAEWNFQPITQGLSNVVLPLGAVSRETVLLQKQLMEGNGASSAMVAAVINDTSAGKKATPSMGIAVSRDRDVRARCDLDNIGHACNNTVGGGGIAAAATPLAKPSGVSGRGGAYVSTKREVHAPRSSDQGLYLTASGPNHELLKKNTIKGAAGGFGDVTFWVTATGQEVALKTAKDTASGRRQQRREIEFLINFTCLHPDAANIVGVIEARTAPVDMLLMRKEPMTLTSMLENAISIDVGAVAQVLFGILTAIDMLHEAGFVQRDIKPDNILVGQDGGGILADFGLCITKTDACLPEFLGDGTADYSAPEITSKLSGSTLCTELYSWFVVFVESMMMRHPFAGEQLFDARTDRLEYLEEKRICMVEDVDDLTGQLESLLDNEEDNAGEGAAEETSLEEQRLQLQEELTTLTSKLEAVRIQEWRLGERTPRQWQPTASDEAMLVSLGEPLSFFKKGRRRDQKREDIASGEAKANPSRLFEGHDWVEWLPGPSRADCKRGVKLALDFLVGKGVLHPDPECRPQDVGSSRMILTEAVALYEEQRQREMELERDDEELKGAAREDSGAGG